MSSVQAAARGLKSGQHRYAVKMFITQPLDACHGGWYAGGEQMPRFGACTARRRPVCGALALRRSRDRCKMGLPSSGGVFLHAPRGFGILLKSLRCAERRPRGCSVCVETPQRSEEFDRENSPWRRLICTGSRETPGGEPSQADLNTCWRAASQRKERDTNE
jgi:hypothetical protein